MKKLFLLIAVVAMILPSCGKINDAIDELDNRLDNLEQISIPTIEQQIESINTQLTSLKETDDAIKTKITELENSDKTTATEISNLKAKDSALEKSISDLQEYVDNQIANAKSEAAAAYATIEQYNAIVSQLSELKSSTDKLGEDLTAKINNEVKSLTDKITDLENRLKAVEDKVEDLLARIQSVSYIPTYSDGKATMKYAGNNSRATLDFKISPKECVEELSKIWAEALKVEAVYTQTRAVSFVDMPIVKFEADNENGVISVTVSGENLSDEFFAGTQEASVALVISDGNNYVMSDYIPMVATEVEASEFIKPNQIGYTSSDGNIVEPYATDVFGANIVSNTYEGGLGVITFDAPITSIGDTAFSLRRSLTSVIIPDSVTSIGRAAFYSCSSLTSVNIPDSVTSIGDRAFYNCSSLTSVNIPDSVTSIGETVFRACSSLTKVTIPDSITEIGRYAFFECSNLTSVTIPDSVTSIGERAFSHCASLTSITIPNSVTSIESGAFSSCSSLTAFYGKFASEDNRCLIINGTLNSFAPAGITFYTIPDSITEIRSNAFYGCHSLTRVNIPDSVTSIGIYAFFDCTSLTTITIPDSVTKIGSSAFSDCPSLTAFYGKFASGDNRCLIIDGVLNVFAPAGVTSYAIPDSITSIENNAFRNCTSLISVTIPDSVTTIRSYAFYCCTSLTSITIPDSVTSIGQYAFYGCSSLTSVYCEPTIPPTGGSDMFAGNAAGRKIYVPSTSVNDYKSKQYWSDYASYIVGYDF